jgi:hypothetical protein
VANAGKKVLAARLDFSTLLPMPFGEQLGIEKMRKAARPAALLPS